MKYRGFTVVPFGAVWAIGKDGIVVDTMGTKAHAIWLIDNVYFRQ